MNCRKKDSQNDFIQVNSTKYDASKRQIQNECIATWNLECHCKLKSHPGKFNQQITSNLNIQNIAKVKMHCKSKTRKVVWPGFVSSRKFPRHQGSLEVKQRWNFHHHTPPTTPPPPDQHRVPYRHIGQAQWCLHFTLCWKDGEGLKKYCQQTQSSPRARNVLSKMLDSNAKYQTLKIETQKRQCITATTWTDINVKCWKWTALGRNPLSDFLCNGGVFSRHSSTVYGRELSWTSRRKLLRNPITQPKGPSAARASTCKLTNQICIV